MLGGRASRLEFEGVAASAYAMVACNPVRHRWTLYTQIKLEDSKYTTIPIAAPTDFPNSGVVSGRPSTRQSPDGFLVSSYVNGF
uniref:Uncharacterized protein n=1 Tax=Fagus sylvatica TaxID=28930 RepID=A0A2N9HL61_FAGSY